MSDNTLLNSGTGGDTIRDIDRSGVKTQVVQLDAGGSSTESLVSLTNPLPVNLASTNFTISAVNSSTAQLAASATFTGTIETSLNQPVVAILMTSDQPITLTMKQYVDLAGTFAVAPIVITAAAGATISQAIAVTGNYINFTAQNTGASTTTTFNLNVSYGNMPPVSKLGNAPSAISEIGGVVVPALVKGTQGTNGISTQDLKDSGRNARIFMLDTYTAAPVAEALQSVVQWYSNAAVAATTTPAVVPAGKVLRLTHVTMSTKSLATVGSAVMRIRANTAGVAVLASPLVWSCECGSKSGATTTAMTGGLDTVTIALPDGIEFPAGTGLGFTLAGYGPTGTLTLEGVTRFVVAGFEY